MANPKKRLPENAPGDFFVDSTCIDCDTCRQLAPAVFAEGDGHAFVHRQSAIDVDRRHALQALVCCPTGSIGTLGDDRRVEVMGDFPLVIGDPVYYCGFTSPSSYGGSSYPVRHPAGNWLIDSPKFLPRLVRRFEQLGGVRHIFLTHRDDVADAERYARHFGSTRYIHRAELSSQPDAEAVLDGNEPRELVPGFVAIPTPGHTVGHCVLLFENRFLFTGDHLDYDRGQKRLSASPDYCWHSWAEQTASMRRLLGFTFEWVLPGHGQRFQLPAEGMRRQLAELVDPIPGSRIDGDHLDRYPSRGFSSKMTDHTASLRGLWVGRRTTAERGLMPTTPMNRVIQHLVAACGRDGMTDGELLTRYLSGRDDDALPALMRRHGPMVWGVCCRMLRSHHDAEDAFQATFLVLVQKANALPDRETVGNWLYGVAHQTAVRMRAVVAKRGGRERQVAVLPEPATAEQYVWNDLSPVLDEELSRLPDKYRVLIVLCDLEGVTRKEVARRLDLPEGTAASRLATARAMLAKRLARRGVGVSGVLLGAVLPQQSAWAAVPTTAAASTIKAARLVAAGQAAATGAIPATVAALTEGVPKAMFVTKIKGVLAAVLLATLVAGAGVVYTTAAAQEGKPSGVGAKSNGEALPAQQGDKPGTGAKKGDFGTKSKEELAVQGIWTLKSIEMDGRTWSLLEGHVVLTVTGEFWIWKEGGRVQVFTYGLDLKQNPKRIDLTARNVKGEEDKKLACIYEIDGDTLTVCESEGDRPTEFGTAAGSKARLLIFKRQAPSQAEAVRQPPGQPKATGGEDAKPAGLSRPEAVGRLKGEWRVVARETDGLRSGEGRPEIKDARVLITEDKITFIDPANKGNAERSFTFWLGRNASPYPPDAPLNFMNEKELFRGIYKIEGDACQLCFVSNADTRDGTARLPTDFSTTFGGKQTLYVLKRQDGDGTKVAPRQEGKKAEPGGARVAGAEFPGGVTPQPALVRLQQGKLVVKWKDGSPMTRGEDGKLVPKVGLGETVGTRRFPVEDVGVTDVKGDTIDEKKLRTLLKEDEDTVALVVPGGVRVDPRHLRLYKDDTLVFAVPALRQAADKEESRSDLERLRVK